MPRRFSPAEGALTTLLFAGLVFTTFQTVAAASWGERVGLAPELALAGFVLGLIGAKSPLRALWSVPLALVVGLQLVLLSQAAASPGLDWTERLAWLSGSFTQWYQTTLRQGLSHDQLVFSTLVLLIAYTIGLCSALLVFRLQNGWWPLVVNATVGLIHLSYATVESIPAYLNSLLVGVLAVASLDLHLRRGGWRAMGLPFQSSSLLWTLSGAGALAVTALLLAFHIPAGFLNTELADRYQTATAPWQDVQRSIDRFVGGGRGQSRPGSGLAFGDSLVPLEDFALSTEPVLRIASPQRRYWRTTTYDRYDGRSIGTSSTSEHRYDSDQDLPFDPDSRGLRPTIEQRVTVLTGGASVLFAADAPLRFNQPILAEERGPGWDQSALRLPSPLQRGQSYVVVSAVPQAGRRELAASPTTHPAWTERYLQLPPTLPPRVAELGHRLTAPTANAFEAALAVEDYLRGFGYSTRAIVPPPGRDWADFLLFDTQAGYCDYLATAMTVLLRTQGIPARVAGGFAPGTFDEREQAWIVHEDDAHSWVEVYFTGYGWQTFEPSAIRPRPEWLLSGRVGHSATDETSAATDALDSDEPFDEDGGFNTGTGLVANDDGPTTIGILLLAIALIALVGGLAWATVALLWDRGLQAEPPARRRYGQLLRLLRLAGWQPPASLTPYELASAAALRCPELASPIAQLVELHVRATYGPGPTPESSPQVEAAWQPIQSALIRLALERALHGPYRPDPEAS